jgi:hypothetical protein
MDGRLLNMIIWLASVSLPFVAMWLLLSPERDADGETPGWGILALPLSLARKVEPLDGWEALEAAPAFQQASVEITAAEAVVPADPVSKPATGVFRIRLHGVVDSDDRPLYCFFDTEKQRWFRLAAGEADDDSGVILEPASRDGHLRLRDLRSGRRFRLANGQKLLVPEKA